MTFRNLRPISWAVVASFAVSFAALTILASQTKATENAKGFYLLGSNTTLAGISPPPGTYLSNWKYFYNGDASSTAARGVALDDLGTTVGLETNVDAEANIFIDLPFALWVSPHKVLGGHLGFGLLVPVGWQDVSADATALGRLTLPDGRTFQRGRRFNVSDD
ncbi:MAG: transporter, partial [Hyphomicrobiaceae bacterium]